MKPTCPPLDPEKQRRRGSDDVDVTKKSGILEVEGLREDNKVSPKAPRKAKLCRSRKDILLATAATAAFSGFPLL